MTNSEIPESPVKRRGRPPSGGKEAILAATLDLLRERGIARLNTREVAQRAGVSEASVYYHYKDRAGLLRAVFEAGLEPLRELAERELGEPDHEQALTRMASAIEEFLDRALPVLAAAQSDTELRDSLAAYMNEHDLGPHRGVRMVATYIKGEQAAGHVKPEVDPEAAALMLVGGCYLRAAQRQMLGHDRKLPSLERLVAGLDELL